MKKQNIFIFRQDLRISDNPGLYQAALNGDVIPIYILDNKDNIGAASKHWLHYSLIELNKKLGLTLNFYKGDICNIILELIETQKIDAVYSNRCYEPWRSDIDLALEKSLKERKVEYQSFNASLLWEPWEVLKADKTSYKVFTPYYKNGCLKPPRQTYPVPEKLITKKLDNSLKLEELDLLTNLSWHKSISNSWKFGEDAAQDRLYEFLDYNLENYQEGRNFPGKDNISKLSPYIHFGEISPGQIWHATQARKHLNNKLTNDINTFLIELGWREFSYHLLHYFPKLPTENFQSKFNNFPWQNNLELLKAWKNGKTGYPIIDAGMRELIQTGFMHNRVRMIVASFLTKNLLIHWHHGEDHFWNYLVDADLASNSASWQWVAGSGADAAPYFRIFNPITQGEKFDLDGVYTRKFVPEIALLPNKYLFKPWEAPQDILTKANIILGENYPRPIIDIKTSRERALSAYHSLR